jgi:hypothetical protein
MLLAVFDPWPPQDEKLLTSDKILSHRFHVLVRSFEVERFITIFLVLILDADLAQA